MSNKYYSQHQQDFVLDRVIFEQDKPGFFLDIGANDGVTYSNTYFLEKNRKWSGICVEPLPNAFQKLSSERSCILENCAIGAETKKEVLMEISGYSEMLSGLKKNYNKKHLSRIDSEIDTYGGSRNEIVIDCVKANELLAKHHVIHIDYCNIDTEGSELEILNSIDYSKYEIDVITVEANYKMERLKIKFSLFLKGYKYVTNLGNDMLFIHKRLLKRLGNPEAISRKITSLIG